MFKLREIYLFIFLYSMKLFSKIIGCVFIAVIISKCTEKYSLPSNLEIQDFVWKGLNAYYLHQDQIPDLADRRFNSDTELNNYLSNFNDPATLFSSLLITEDTKSVFVEDDSNLPVSGLRTSFTNGLEFGIIKEPNTTQNVIAYITHILPNSDADSKSNIARGNFFYAVDDVQLTEENYLDILLNGKDSLKLKMAEFDGENLIRDTDSVEILKKAYNHEPIFINKVFPAISTGYLMYNNDFSENYINDLNNVFLEFKNQAATKLILDLRYNIGGGGFVKNISEIAAMITGQFSDQVLLNETWNAKAQPWFLENQPDSLQTKFPTQLNELTPINHLQATAVYIILNGNNYQGSSAIELLVNSLNPYIDVTLFGSQTFGNNTGSINLYNSIDYDEFRRSSNHNAILQPIVLNFLNKDNETYSNGFAPDIQLCAYEDILNMGVLGEISDPLLNAVLNYIETGSTGATGVCNPLEFEFLFNSIDSQRPLDTGMFITRDLPNTI